MVDSLSLATDERSAWLDERIAHLAFLGTAHLVFAAAFTPLGVRSGQWAVSWLSDPDCLVYAAAGAMIVHPIILYPMWAAFGPGGFLRRFAITALLCAAFLGAEFCRGWQRGHTDSPFVAISVALALFSVITLGLRLMNRRWKWRIAQRDATSAPAPTRRVWPQFGLKRLLQGVTLAACILALYRYFYPHGLPPETIEQAWREITRAARVLPFIMLLLLPTAAVAWSVLALGERRNASILAAVASVAGLDAGAVWLGATFGLYHHFLFTTQAVIAMQFGATVAVCVSVLALRCCGYRIVRPGSPTFRRTNADLPRLTLPPGRGR